MGQSGFRQDRSYRSSGIVLGDQSTLDDIPGHGSSTIGDQMHEHGRDVFGPGHPERALVERDFLRIGAAAALGMNFPLARVLASEAAASRAGTLDASRNDTSDKRFAFEPPLKIGVFWNCPHFDDVICHVIALEMRISSGKILRLWRNHCFFDTMLHMKNRDEVFG